MVVYFKYGYKNRNDISQDWIAGNRNHSILSRRYLIQGVKCLENWRLDKKTLDWASRNNSPNSAANWSFQESCSCAIIRRVSNQEVATETASLRAYCHLCDPGIRKWCKWPLTPAKLGIGHWTITAATLNSWRHRKTSYLWNLKLIYGIDVI